MTNYNASASLTENPVNTLVKDARLAQALQVFSLLFTLSFFGLVISLIFPVVSIWYAVGSLVLSVFGGVVVNYMDKKKIQREANAQLVMLIA
jgi:ABC-type multidrug transport system permease subunit